MKGRDKQHTAGLHIFAMHDAMYTLITCDLNKLQHAANAPGAYQALSTALQVCLNRLFDP
jgi:hypothetical protein